MDPMTRAHVRLLGPCFKTGRVEDRPIRHRPVASLTVETRAQDAITALCEAVRPRSCSLGRPKAGATRQASSVPQCVHLGGLNTRPRRVELPSRRAHDHRRTGRGTRQRRKCTLPRGRRTEMPVLSDQAIPVAPSSRAEFPGSTMRIHPFASMRFHVLLNSLFKVLFNFPSRYLSAIGLVPVFSLRWSLPPALGCIPKQPDSKGARSHRVSLPPRA